MNKGNNQTTAVGVIGAVLLVLAQLLLSHTLSAQTGIEAVVIAALGYLSGDANTINFFKNNQAADLALQLGDAVSKQLSASLPNAEIWSKIHNSLDALNQNVNALPTATASAVTQALPAPAVIVNTVADVPAPAAPAVPLYNPYSGKLLTEDPLPATN